ncbi:hypothetical protein Nepgr_009022 [Nepenthes gracilis]|uniref:Uncharacterized protein n=1 Tax=Nepenthes gracilis TaxID=150966 RepID=A0AAD3XJS7_NEPGR|nr:hypothetical protein Nepgr_009022 [Nepenthes gracilis]
MLMGGLTDSDGEENLPEESGWTQYLDDFSSYNRQKEEEFSSSNDHSSFITASLISDAGSGAEWKNRVENSLVSGLPTMPRKLNFMSKRITRQIPFDHSLEDTASSPVNSPKIAMSFGRAPTHSRKTEENSDNYVSKGGGCDYEAEAKKTEHEMDITGKKIDSCAELLKNKEGLFWVPVSSTSRNYDV